MVTYSDLAQKTVLVTGGASGIGKAVVEQFAQQGATVAFIDIDNEQSAHTQQAIKRDYGVDVYFAQCDLRQLQQSLAAVECLIQQVGEIDVLVNNAGHDEAHDFSLVDEAYWDDRVAVNLKHQYFMIQKLAPAMQRNGGGAIVNLGSISWMMGAKGVSIYTTLKSAISGLTKTFARELGEHNIRVNAVAPGWVLTPRQRQKLQRQPEKSAAYLERQCLKFHLQAEMIANAVLWLASDQACAVSSQTLVVDGGVV